MRSLTACCGNHDLHRGLSGLAVPADAVAPARYSAGQGVRDRADLIVLAHIATGVPGAPAAEAMAVSGGKIIGIGSAADVANLATADTTIVKPDGIVIPGLIEPHMHIWTSLLNLTWTDLSHEACPTFDDVVAVVKAAAAKAAPGEWVLGKLFDPSLYPGEPNLTRVILDQASPNNPVAVMNASMHFLYVNSLTLQQAGIDDQSVAPPGGTFGRADGRLTGVIGEAPAMLLVLKPLPKPTAEQTATGIRQILTAAAAQGVTSVREATTGAIIGVGEVALLHQLNGAQRLPTRVSTAQYSLLPGSTDPADAAAKWKAAGITPFSGDEMVRADAWKVVTDGSNQGRSGYFLQPYLGENNGGHANFTPEGLPAALKAGLDNSWQIMVHTNGDAAVEFALSALELLLPGYGTTDLRHRLEHVSFTTDDQLRRIAAAGLHPSFLMNHVYYWGAAFRDTILGPARADRLDRVASAYQAGLKPSLHSDYNVSKIHPLQSARTAVLRIMQPNGEVLNAAECATPEQALAGITTNAAFQIHADDRGTLEVGKRADWAVVSEDPWGSDPHGWDQITVHQTFIDGTVAYEA